MQDKREMSVYLCGSTLLETNSQNKLNIEHFSVFTSENNSFYIIVCVNWVSVLALFPSR
jgi:hypothetical protein